MHLGPSRPPRAGLHQCAMPEVGSFFDANAGSYGVRDAGLRAFHVEIARRLEAALHGSVLCIGGPWAQHRVPAGVRLTIVDLSRGMLDKYRRDGATVALADARALPFGHESFDHVVMPLVLHHVAGRNADEAQAGARAVIAEAARVLRRGGRLWISELCVGRAIYRAERALAPATRGLLDLAGVPLVIMHSARFYRNALREAGLFDAHAEAVEVAGASSLDLITPVIGVPWLKVPRFLYPVTPTLLTARRG